MAAKASTQSSPALSALAALLQSALPQAADEGGTRQPEVNMDMGQEQNIPASTRALREVQAQRGRIY